MSGTLSPDVIAAINKVAATPLGRKYDRMARRRYGISGKRLAAKEVVGESGGRRNAVSSAGARGYTQFIKPTRDEYLEKFGVDAWAGPKQALKAMMLYQTRGGGIESYNPGMPGYADYILGQKLDPSVRQGLRRGGPMKGGNLTLRGPQHTDVSLGSRTIPGQSFEAERQAARANLLLSPGGLDMQKLLDYKQQVNQLKDVPARIVPGDLKVRRSGGDPLKVPTKGPVASASRAGSRQPPSTGRTLDEMFRIAGDVDKLNKQGKVPYAWGGGHGSKPAKVGEPVDCSGFVSQILGVAPRVSGDFQTSWGKPGRGKWVTVYANQEHVLIAMKDPRTRKVRWFATSRSNPGGGAGEIAKPPAAYLARFTARHPGRR